jgi:hypothetical protein
MGHLRIHPDGRQIAFTSKPRIAATGKLQTDKVEIWTLENFLPPRGDQTAPAVADASAGKGKSAGAGQTGPAVVAP